MSKLIVEIKLIVGADAEVTDTSVDVAVESLVIAAKILEGGEVIPNDQGIRDALHVALSHQVARSWGAYLTQKVANEYANAVITTPEVPDAKA